MPTSPVLYLDSDKSPLQWTPQPAGTHNTKLGISGPSDSTYCSVNGTISGAIDRYGIQDSPVEATLITAINCQIRSLYVAIQGSVFTITFNYYNGATLIGSIVFDAAQGHMGSGAFIDSPIIPLTGLSLSKAEWDAIEVEVEGVANGGPTDRVRVAEVWHTVDYNTAPPSGGTKICVSGEFKTSEQGSGSFNTQQNVAGSFVNHPLNVGGQFVTSQAASGEFKTSLSVQGSIPDCD